MLGTVTRHIQSNALGTRAYATPNVLLEMKRVSVSMSENFITEQNDLPSQCFTKRFFQLLTSCSKSLYTRHNKYNLRQ